MCFCSSFPSYSVLVVEHEKWKKPQLDTRYIGRDPYYRLNHPNGRPKAESERTALVIQIFEW